MGTEAVRAILIEEIDLALRPPVHESRVLSGGSILDPASEARRDHTPTPPMSATSWLLTLAQPASVHERRVGLGVCVRHFVLLQERR
jgi:hypothetical protein